MKKLFFDLQISGHHSEYIRHLIAYIVEENLNDDFYFVLHTDFSAHFRDIVKKASQNTNIHLVYATNDELKKIERGNIVTRSFQSYQVMNRYALKFNVDYVCLLSMNTFQLALGFYRSSFKIDGILFKQFLRMDKRENFLRYYRKFLQTWFFCANNSLGRIFVLNDQKTADELNSLFRTRIFQMLADPIPDLSPLENFDLYEEYQIEREKKVYLHIGSLSERKGTIDILDAIALLSKEIRGKLKLLLVGKASPELSLKIEDKIKSLNITSEVAWDKSFVSNEKMRSLFLQCHCVLMPYKNSEASSGILGHAAAANKIVIATGKGLLRDIVTEHKLGLLIDEVKPNLIADKIEESFSVSDFYEGSKQFVSDRTVRHFAERILTNNLQVGNNA